MTKRHNSETLALFCGSHMNGCDENFNNPDSLPLQNIFMQCLAHPFIEIPAFIYTIIDFYLLLFLSQKFPADVHCLE